MKVPPFASVVSVVSAVPVPPPTAPVNVVAPLLLTVSACVPSTVAPKLTAVPASVVSAARVTASPYVWVPLVVIVPLSAVVPPPPVARFLIPVKLIPEIVVVPPRFSVRSWLAPATPGVSVPLDPLSVRSPASRIAPPPEAIDTAPVELWVRAPVAVLSVTSLPETLYPPVPALTAEPTVAAPAAWIETLPPLCVVRLP